MYIQSSIHLIASLRTELGIGLKEAMDLTKRLEDAQVERALDHGIDPPVDVLAAYARRAAKRVNDAKRAERLAYSTEWANAYQVSQGVRPEDDDDVTF